MRPASCRHVLALFGFVALSSVLTGCPEKGAPPDKTSAEPERAEPDEDGKTGEAKKPAPTPAAAPPVADDKKPDDDKDKGGW